MAIVLPPNNGPGTTYFGTVAKDRVYGAATDDVLLGFGGNDLLIGGAGRDQVIGGDGNDTLVGDGTSVRGFDDIFIFRGDFGTDVILDFDVERDTLEIARGLEIKRVSDVLDHAEQQRNHVVIDFGDGNSVKLLHVELSELIKDNFDIV